MTTPPGDLPIPAPEEPADARAGEIQRVLRERARALAERRGLGGARQLAAHKALVLGVGDEQFAIPVEEVLQIGRGQQITPLPGAPPELVGISNFRGAVYSVMDLTRILGGRATAERGWCVFLRNTTMRIALMVDRVETILDYQAVLPMEGAGAHLAGMLPGGIPLLDTAALLSHSAFSPPRKNPL